VDHEHERSRLTTRRIGLFFGLLAMLTVWVFTEVLLYRSAAGHLDRAENAALQLRRAVDEAVLTAVLHEAGGASLPGSAPHFEARVTAAVGAFAEAFAHAGPPLAASQRAALFRDVRAIGALSDEITGKRGRGGRPDPSLRTLVALMETHGRPLLVSLAGQTRQAAAARRASFERRLVTAGVMALVLMGGLGLTVLLPLRARLAHLETAIARSADEASLREAHTLSAMAHAAHDIRTTLHGVTGMAGLLQRTQLDPQQERHVALMAQSSTTLLRLVNEVMDLAKVASNEMAVTVAPYDPLRMIVDTVCPFAPDLQRRGIRVLVDPDPALPRRSLGDETRLRQVLSNLVHNAAKFTEAGHIIVESRWMSDLGLMEVIVSDTGPGVAPEQRSRIFGAYKQVGDGQARGEGTGLGLALARRIVARLGGDMGVRAAPGGGAAFWFRVPLSPSTRSAVTARADLAGARIRLAIDWPPMTAMVDRHLRAHGAEPVMGEVAADIVIADVERRDGRELMVVPQGARGDPTPVPLPVDPDQLVHAVADVLLCRPRLTLAVGPATGHGAPPDAPLALVADDSEINRLVTAALLEDAGWRVETVEDGAAAVEAARRLRPRLILLDLAMPRLDGLSAARAIRALPQAAGMPEPVIVAATGRDDPDAAEVAARAGMDGLLVKPLTAGSLAAALRGVAAPLERAG
jgi:signal transduction histidine kinase/CheY-like chemotaxis protein